MVAVFKKALPLFTLLLVLPSLVFGAYDKDELKSRASALVSKGTHRRLSRAHALMAKDKVTDAIVVLNKLKTSTANRPGEQAQVLQALGFAYAQKDQLGKALQNLQAALKLNALPYSPTLSTIYTVAQVQMSQEKYKAAEATLKDWFSLADEPSPDAYVLMASIYAQKKNQKKALELVTKAIDMTTAPKESWLSFAVAMNYELKRYKEASRLLEKLVALYPQKKKYWKQLAGVYLNIDENSKALATLGLADKGQYLKEEAEIMNHVSLNLYGGVPYRAGKILAEALKKKKVKATQKNYEILGDCWAQAEEMDKALAAYAVSAKLSKDGRIFAKQGRIYLEKEDWVNSEKYLSEGLAKGKIRRAANIYMALGIARFNLKKFDAATKAFETAAKQSKKLKAQSDQWIAYVKAEEERLNPKTAKVDESEDGDSKVSETL